MKQVRTSLLKNHLASGVEFWDYLLTSLLLHYIFITAKPVFSCYSMIITSLGPHA